MKQYDVITAGLTVMDILVPGVDAGVFKKDTHNLDKVTYATGGDALNVAMNLASLGARVCHSGWIGNDTSGNTIRTALQNNGIDTALLKAVDGMSTGTSIVLSENSGERHFLLYSGPNLVYDGSDLTEEVLSKASILCIGSIMGLPGLENGNLIPLLQRARKQGVITVMDACGCREDYNFSDLIDALEYVDVFIPSLEEALQIAGAETAEEAAQFLLDHGVKVAGVKKGSKGSYITDGVNRWNIPCYQVAEPVDTTGAGDSFMSGFLRGMLLGYSYDDCARLGSAVSHNCIQYLGATTHKTTLEAAMAVMKA